MKVHMLDHTNIKFHLQQLIQQQLTPQEQFDLATSIQQYVEYLKRNIAEKAIVPWAEIIPDNHAEPEPEEISEPEQESA